MRFPVQISPLRQEMCFVCWFCDKLPDRCPGSRPECSDGEIVMPSVVVDLFVHKFFECCVCFSFFGLGDRVIA